MLVSLEQDLQYCRFKIFVSSETISKTKIIKNEDIKYNRKAFWKYFECFLMLRWESLPIQGTSRKNFGSCILAENNSKRNSERERER
jgi:hypothetical protein